MGAEINIKYDCKYNWDHLTEKELELLNTTGIELNIDQLQRCILPDGSFQWKGQKVLVYIKEQWAKSYYDEIEYKYHIANCATLINMKLNGRINRYVISTRKDGLFEITLRNGRTRSIISENIEKPMNVCKNCLSTMIMNYPGEYEFFHYSSFELSDFLKKYNTRIKYMPEYNNKTVPNNEYPENWSEIATAYKNLKKWICEKCGLDCSTNKSFLHCHHKGPKYDNNFEHLKALCKTCHRMEPGHRTMK